MVDVGAVVAGYRLIKAVGNGPFGLVYKGEDAHGQPLAIKFLKSGFLARADGVSAFGRLGASTAVHSQLAHPYLVRVFGTVADPQQNAYGQLGEYLDGVTLNRAPVDPKVLRGHDPQGLASLLTWYEQLGDVLGWLHAQGMVHGNLKPTNVFLVSLATEHHVKLLDLSWSAIGVAAISRGPASFVSPEQYDGAIPDHLSDQWSMATMLERTFTGGHHRLSLGVLPAALVQTVQRATRHEPKQRFRSMTEFTDALREIRLDLQRAVGEDVTSKHGANTLPAGEVPNDVASAYPRVPRSLSDTDGTLPDSHSATTDLQLRGVGEWKSTENTIPYMERDSVSSRPISRPGSARGSEDSSIEEEARTPLRRHAVGDILSEGLSGELQKANPADTLPGISSNEVQIERKPRGNSLNTNEPTPSRSATPKASDIRQAGYPGSDLHNLPLGRHGEGEYRGAVPRSSSFSAPVAMDAPLSRAVSAEPRPHSAVSRSYSNVGTGPLGRQASDMSAQERERGVSTLGSDRGDMPHPHPAEPINVDPFSPPFIEAAPTPVYAPRVAALLVFVGALSVGAWSVTQSEWSRVGGIHDGNDVLISTASVARDGAKFATAMAPDSIVKAPSWPVPGSEIQDASPPAAARLSASPAPTLEPRSERKRRSLGLRSSPSRRTTEPTRKPRVRNVPRGRQETTRSGPDQRTQPRLTTSRAGVDSQTRPGASPDDPREAQNPTNRENPLPTRDDAGLASELTLQPAPGSPSPATDEAPEPVAEEAKEESSIGLVGFEIDESAGGEPSDSRASSQAGCDAGQVAACIVLGDDVAQSGDKEAAIGAYASACRLKSGAGCMKAARLWTGQPKEGARRARQYFLDACKLELAEGCYQASIRTVGARSKALKARACALGRSSSCESSDTSSANSLRVD